MEHEHNHEHHHEHVEGEEGKELLALLEYMIKHNEAHAQELMSLAKRLKDGGEAHVYEHVLKAIERYNEGNRELEKALDHLKEGE